MWAYACVQCLIALMRYVSAPALLRPARWCAAGWCATATTPTPTCSAAPSATQDWAASVCTRTACSPTAAATRGWRTASSASAWCVLTHAWTPHTFMKLPSQECSAFIQSQLQRELKQHMQSFLCHSAHTRNATNTLVSMEMLMNERCALWKKKSRREVLWQKRGGVMKRRIGRLRRGENADCFSSPRRRKAVGN